MNDNTEITVPFKEIDILLVSVPEGVSLIGKTGTRMPDGTVRYLANVGGILCLCEGKIVGNDAAEGESK